MLSMNEKLLRQASNEQGTKMSKASDTSVVDKEKMPDMVYTNDQLTNLPETLDAAIARIMALEMSLDDLARASDIARYSGQFEVLDSFIASANEILETKIGVKEQEPTEMKITIIS